MSVGRNALAAAVARLAVEDLATAYKKVRRWAEMDARGELKDFVEKEVRNQQKKNVPDYRAVTFSVDDATALVFFDVNSEQYQLYFSILDLESLPTRIADQRDYIKEKRALLEPKVRGYKRWAMREIGDENI